MVDARGEDAAVRSGAFADLELLFVVGCARSGTTWLQLLLSAHPEVATIKESHLFDHFIGPALKSWDELAEDPRELGPGPVLSRDRFVALQRRFALEVFEGIRVPGTRVVVDKTPDHALWIDALLTVFPRARILHVVRDPRDVTASLLAAGADWGSHWAPDGAFEAAWRWRQHVEAAREADTRSDAFRELRYEDLCRATSSELRALYRWLGLSTGDGLVERAVEDATVDRMRSGRTAAPWDLASEPDGFVRKGGTGHWRDELTRGQVAVVEYVCRGLMPLYGYEPTRRRRVPPVVFYVPWLRDQILRRL